MLMLPIAHITKKKYILDTAKYDSYFCPGQVVSLAMRGGAGRCGNICQYFFFLPFFFLLLFPPLFAYIYIGQSLTNSLVWLQDAIIRTSKRQSNLTQQQTLVYIIHLHPLLTKDCTSFRSKYQTYCTCKHFLCIYFMSIYFACWTMHHLEM